MAARRRKRSRGRRQSGSPQVGKTARRSTNGDGGPAVPPAGATEGPRTGAPARPPDGARGGPVLERPRAPWHPLPLAEILIVAGAITVAVSLTSGGPERAAPGLIAGVAATLIGTGEVTAREHFRGYRSHALLLALIPVIAFHTLVFLAVSAVGSMPREANIALLALDLGLLYALFRFLRTRFLEARRRALEAAGGRLRGERGKG